MGDIHSPKPALLVIAASSQYSEALEWGRRRAGEEFGAEAAASEPFDFVETDYYEEEMGPNLQKQFWVYTELIDPARLAEVKRQTNQWEQEYATLRAHPEQRPLNLDPGYLTLAKLVLASTKDHAHRIYLRDGIYAEVTLSYRDKAWQSFPWTFPDYRRDDYHDFFTKSRELLRRSGRIN